MTLSNQVAISSRKRDKIYSFSKDRESFVSVTIPLIDELCSSVYSLKLILAINMTDDVTTPLTLRQDDDDMTSSIDGNNFLMGEISEERRRKLHDL